MRTYDMAVLGGGPGGYVAALRGALRGAKVCCIESRELGGVCLNRGCIPTKAMLHATDLLSHTTRFGEFGFGACHPEVNGEVFMARVTKVAAGLRQGVEFLLKKRQVDVIAGEGRVVAKDRIQVRTRNGEEEVQAKNIILATGSRPIRPGFAPWDSGRVITTDEATTAKTLPESIIIVGGGVIGCEFATIYSELGIPTTLVEMLDRLCDPLDDDVSSAITRSLQKRTKAMTGTKIVGIKADANGVTAELSNGQSLQAAIALVAVGRVPNTENIGLQEMGIAMDGKVVKVDDRCRTNVENIYAIGDLAETRQYAHLASRMGIVAADNATGHDSTDNREVVPEVVYTHPEAANVGLCEREARAKYPDLRVSRFPYTAIGMARAFGETEGGVKIMAEPAGGRIVGAAVIGRHASEVIQEFTIALRHGLTVEQLAQTIHPHPTFNEAVHESAEAWLGMPLHAIL